MSADTIAVDQCRRLLERGESLNILDVRTPAEFARVHARGARLMPLGELDLAAVRALREHNGGPIYLICQSGARAAKARQRLQQAGLSGICCIEGGTAAWEKMGLPVERGSSRVISLERQVRIGAGSLVLLGVILAVSLHWAFLAIPAFVGAGLIFAGITDYCGMAMVLGKMPWNRAVPVGPNSCSLQPVAPQVHAPA